MSRGARKTAASGPASCRASLPGVCPRSPKPPPTPLPASTGARPGPRGEAREGARGGEGALGAQKTSMRSRKGSGARGSPHWVSVRGGPRLRPPPHGRACAQQPREGGRGRTSLRRERVGASAQAPSGGRRRICGRSQGPATLAGPTVSVRGGGALLQVYAARRGDLGPNILLSFLVKIAWSNHFTCSPFPEIYALSLTPFCAETCRYLQ